MLLFNKFARFSELYIMPIHINIVDRRRAIYYILSRAIDSIWQSIVVGFLFIARPQNDFWWINYILRETVILCLWVMLGSSTEELNGSYGHCANECRLCVVKMIIRGTWIFSCRIQLSYHCCLCEQMLKRSGLMYRISNV